MNDSDGCHKMKFTLYIGFGRYLNFLTQGDPLKLHAAPKFFKQNLSPQRKSKFLWQKHVRAQGGCL